MNTTKRILGGCLACLGLFGGMLTALPARAASPTAVTSSPMTPRAGVPRDAVQVRMLSGEVSWRPKGGAWQPVVQDQVLHRADEVRTGERALLVMELPVAAGFVHLMGSSQVAIADLKCLPGFEGPQSAVFTLNHGRAFLRLRKFNRSASRLRVETPGGSAVVRGTEFLVAVDSQQATTVGVASGMVAVTAQQQSVDVRPGESSHFTPTTPPAPPVTVKPVPIRLLSFLPVEEGAAVSGTAAPGGTVIVNGISGNVGPDGHFSVTIPLTPEIGQAVIECLDTAGHVETLTLNGRAPNVPASH